MLWREGFSKHEGGTYKANHAVQRAPLFSGPSVIRRLVHGHQNRWLADWASRSREGSSDHAANDFVVVHSQLRADGRCDVGDCLEKLYSMGIRSLMVEVSYYANTFGGSCESAASNDLYLVGRCR